MFILTSTLKNLIKLPRNVKRTVAIIIDLGLCIFCTWLAFYLRLEQFIKINDITILAVLISVIIAIPIFWLNGLYRTIFRFGDSSIISAVAIALFVYGLIYFTVMSIFGIQGIPRSIGIIQPLLLFFGIISSRLTIRYFFNSYHSFKNLKKKNILIYGAGVAGRQLMSSLENNSEMKSVGFLDDNKQFHNQTILGQTVFDPTKIRELINLKDIDNDNIISKSSVQAKDSYDVQDNRFANYIAEEKVEHGLLKSISQNIRDLLIRDLNKYGNN